MRQHLFDHDRAAIGHHRLHRDRRQCSRVHRQGGAAMKALGVLIVMSPMFYAAYLLLLNMGLL